MKPVLGLVVGSFLVTSLIGCSPYVDGFQYAPRPAVATVPGVPPQQGAQVTAYASIIGVRREDRKAGIPESVEARLRIENDGPQTLVFDPRSMELLDGMLLKFPAPVVRPPEVVELEPMQSAVVSAFFPFPPGHSYRNTDLDSLQLKWVVQIDRRPVTQSVSFHRLYPVGYYYPYPPPPFWVGGEVVIVRHRR